MSGWEGKKEDRVRKRYGMGIGGGLGGGRCFVQGVWEGNEESGGGNWRGGGEERMGGGE